MPFWQLRQFRWQCFQMLVADKIYSVRSFQQKLKFLIYKQVALGLYQIKFDIDLIYFKLIL